MRAGKLTHSITIQRATQGVDDYGTATEAWATTGTVRAQIIQQSTEEFMRAFGESAENATVFRIRFRANIALADRIIFDGKPYDLKEIKELGRRQGLDLRCVAAA